MLCFSSLFSRLGLFVFLAAFQVQPCAAQRFPALAPNFLTLPDKGYNLPLYWQGDSAAGKWEPHAVLLLPVTLAGCPQQFYMQFDLGVPSTIFYKNKLQEIRQRYPKTVSVNDTATSLSAYRFQVGNMPVTASTVMLQDYQSKRIDWADKKAKTIIGTIGADFIEGRAIVFDYPRQRLYNSPQLPGFISPEVVNTNFVFTMRSVLLPAFIKGKSSLLFFDTGSSAYELLTDRKTAEEMAVKDAVPFRRSVRSWNRTLTATTLATGDSITVADQSLPLQHATYMEGASDTQIGQMMKMGIGGMTGNKLFIHCLLVLDVKAKKFAVLPQKH